MYGPAAWVVRKVRDVGGDVEEVSGPNDGVVLQAFAVPDARFAAERVDGGLMRGMFVGARASAGRDGDELHVDVLRAYRFCRDADGVLQALLAGEWPVSMLNPKRVNGGGGWVIVGLRVYVRGCHSRDWMSGAFGGGRASLPCLLPHRIRPAACSSCALSYPGARHLRCGWRCPRGVQRDPG
jgi:hypothetical protein